MEYTALGSVLWGETCKVQMGEYAILGVFEALEWEEGGITWDTRYVSESHSILPLAFHPHLAPPKCGAGHSLIRFLDDIKEYRRFPRLFKSST